MKRLLFVDDEPKVLQGIERSFHSYRKHYEMVFVTSGEEALVRLEASPFDVLVSDMRMPGMDGSALLAQVRTRFPGVARIVLSGHGRPRSNARLHISVITPASTRPCGARSTLAATSIPTRRRARPILGCPRRSPGCCVRAGNEVRHDPTAHLCQLRMRRRKGISSYRPPTAPPGRAVRSSRNATSACSAPGDRRSPGAA